MVRWVLVALAAALSGCGGPDNGQFWTAIAKVRDSPSVVLVRVHAGGIKNRSVYNEAVRVACHEETRCRIMFFADGDATPPIVPYSEFVRAGSLGFKPILAAWLGNGATRQGDFVQWDCERAGIEDSPPSALCGPGASEDYEAVLSLASRAGATKACNWPKTSDAEIAQAFVAAIQEPGRRQMFQVAFDQSFRGGNAAPDRLNECDKILRRNEAAVVAARRRLQREHLPAAQYRGGP